jgi:uridine phosphorylase
MFKRNSALQQQLPFAASELPVTPQGRIYHLDLKPDELASNILIVGDPDRVPLIAGVHLKSTEIDRFHRGLRTITGDARKTGQRVSIVTSGMGTSSLEVILGELVALHEIDFQSRNPRKDVSPINIIRVGTSGGLQTSTRLATPIISSYGVGLDNTGLFYDAEPHNGHCARIEEELHVALAEACASPRFRGRIWPYVASASEQLVDEMKIAAEEAGLEVKSGLTVSNSGFFANQGRDIARIAPSVPNIDQVLAAFDPGLGGQMIENMEMETSFLFHFMNSLGHRAGSICPAIANRAQNTFATKAEIQDGIHASTEVALVALSKLA